MSSALRATAPAARGHAGGRARRRSAVGQHAHGKRARRRMARACLQSIADAVGKLCISCGQPVRSLWACCAYAVDSAVGKSVEKLWESCG